MFAAQDLFFPLFRCGVDKAFLHEFQRSWASLGRRLSVGDLFDFLAIFLVLIFLLLILRLWLKPRKVSFGLADEGERIEDPTQVRDIIERSIALRAVYDIEIYDRGYEEIYKCPALKINESGQILAALEVFTNPGLDFRDREARAVFRMSRRGEQEFYQFETRSDGLELSTMTGRRERVLRLEMPKVVSVGQKRRFLRLQPTGRHAIKVTFMDSLLPGTTLPLRGFETLHQAPLTDLSIGGLQTVLKIRGDRLRIRGDQDVYVRFRLESAGLHVENPPDTVIAKVKVIAVERLATGRRFMSREADKQTVGPYQVRLMFTRRGRIDKAARTVTFEPIQPASFDDLGRWIQAYQRHRIQEERDTKPQPSQVRNLYESKPLEVEPKYPPKPPRREPLE
ncbi:MAG: hypothetical protein KKB20_08760 [Proteobacteria bacterium]|nr:hypothetical protein [Pseudomonadota bacterium]